jgi:hypothetical protein
MPPSLAPPARPEPAPPHQTKKWPFPARHRKAAISNRRPASFCELALPSMSFLTALVERTQVFHVAPTARPAALGSLLHPLRRLIKGYRPVKKIPVTTAGVGLAVMFQ